MLSTVFRYFIVLFTIILPGKGYSDNFSDTFNTSIVKLDPLTINDGLSQGFVTSIFQDKTGYMWFTTKDGLNKYDGYKFTIYRNDIYDKYSLIDNDLVKVREDDLGRLWVLTRNKGLDLFDRSTEKFRNFNIRSMLQTSEGPEIIINFEFLNATSILLLTDRKIYILKFIGDPKDEHGLYDLNNYSLQHLQVMNKESSFVPSVNNNLFRDSKGTLWLGDHKELFNIDLDLRSNTYKLHNVEIDHIIPRSNFKPDAFSFVEDTLNKHLYIRHPFCLLKYDLNNGSFKLILDYKKLGRIINHQPEIDHNGFLWVYISNRPAKINVSNGSIFFLQSEGENNKLYYVNGFYEDNSGNMWISSIGHGLLKIDLRKENFNHSAMEEGQFSTRSIVPLPDDRLAISGWSFGIFKVFNTRTKKFESTLPSPNSAIYKQFPGFALDYINMVVHQNGDIIYAKDYNSILLANKNESKVKKIYVSSRSSYYFPLYLDGDILWFCNNGNLVRLNIYTQEAKEYEIPFKGFLYNKYQMEVNQILNDGKGNIWLATINGLHMFNIKKGTWRSFFKNEDDLKKLSADIIYTICMDPYEPEKFIWLGTNGAGLTKLNFISGKTRHFTTKNGLPNNIIYGILSDENGYLWMSTNMGISKFNVRTETFINFDEHSGLQSNEFNRYSYCKLSSGEIVFGGVNGFNYFYPSLINLNVYKPIIDLTELFIHNKPFLKIKEKDKNDVVKIKLGYKDDVIRFQFASLDFTSPENNLFTYKLEGVDETWSPPSSKNEVTYTNLQPGSYTFSVKGTNSDGVWSDKPYKMLITIPPPWWATWWFRGAILLATCGILYGFFQYRIRQTKKLYTLRETIASDLHDEIGSTLSSISLYSTVAKKMTLNKSLETGKILDQINESTESIMESMSDIVWAINTRNDNFDNILNRMQGLAVQVLELQNCNVHFINEKNFSGKRLNMEQRKNLYLLYKEAINNISKYSQASNVWIEFNYDKKLVTLRIKDDGVGLDNTISSNINGGNGFYTMKKRSEELNGKLSVHSEIGKGTEIELVFKN